MRMLVGVAVMIPWWAPGAHAAFPAFTTSPLFGSNTAMRSSRAIRSTAERVTIWLWL